MSAAQNVQDHPAVKQALGSVQYYHDQLDKELSKYPVALKLEQTTGVPKVYAVGSGFLLLALLTLFNPVALPISNLIGWGFPAYASFRAIESPGFKDDVQWLTYWVVFGFFNFLESIALRLVLYYFPWYLPFKTVFVVWLWYPNSRGAEKTYNVVLKPILSNVNSGAIQQRTTATADRLRAGVDGAAGSE